MLKTINPELYFTWEKHNRLSDTVLVFPLTIWSIFRRLRSTLVVRTIFRLRHGLDQKQDSRRCILRCSSSLLPLQVAESSLPYISTITKQVANLNFGEILTSWAFSSQALRSCLGSTNSSLPLILRPNTAINCISASDVRRNTPQFSSNTSGHLLEI